MFVGLVQILAGVVDPPVGLEQFLPDNIDLFPLLVGQRTGLVHYILHVHQAFRNMVYLMAAFPCHFVLKLQVQIDLLLLLLLAVLLYPTLPRFFGSGPPRPLETASAVVFDAHGGEGGDLRVLGEPIVMRI